MWIPLTPEALVTAVASGLVFGFTLPGLFAQLVEDLIPEEQIDVLNSSAGRLVPLLAVPLGAVFFGSQAIVDLWEGAEMRAIGRFVVYVVFTLAVTTGDLLWQRRRRPITRLHTRVEALNAAATASEDRRRRLVVGSLDGMAAAYAQEEERR